LRTVAQASTFALQSLHAAAAASDKVYWQPTLAIACSPLDAEQTNVMIDRHDRPIADFTDTECTCLSKHQRIITTDFGYW